MDMKKILQAFDTASTKPVEGSNDMAKFLRVVKEANLNQPIVNEGPTSGPEYEYQLKALQNLLTTETESWKQNLTKWRINNLQTNGVTSFKTDYSKNAGGVTIPTKVVDSDAWVKANPNLLKRLPSECQPSMAIHEGSNPHKVALPVQMAMQHYQKEKNTEVVRKDRLIDKYFTEAEAAITQRKEERRAAINQYASVIAERVMMKESKLDERSTTEKQARTMAAAAHNPEFAKKVGIKPSVAKEFNQKDKGTALLSNAMKGKKKKVKEHEIPDHSMGFTGGAGPGLQTIEELSTELLGRYKKAAYADAKKADAEGDYARGDKRFKGINKATNKQFANDLKKHDQKEVAEELDEDLDRLYELRDQIEEAIKQRLDPKCWKGKHKEGTKIKGGVRVNNCVPNKK